MGGVGGPVYPPQGKPAKRLFKKQPSTKTLHNPMTCMNLGFRVAVNPQPQFMKKIDKRPSKQNSTPQSTQTLKSPNRPKFLQPTPLRPGLGFRV